MPPPSESTAMLEARRDAVVARAHHGDGLPGVPTGRAAVLADQARRGQLADQAPDGAARQPGARTRARIARVARGGAAH